MPQRFDLLDDLVKVVGIHRKRPVSSYLFWRNRLFLEVL